MPCALTVAVSALTVAVSALTVAVLALTVAVSALTVSVSALTVAVSALTVAVSRDTHEACVVIVWPGDPSYIPTYSGGRSAHKSLAFRGDGRAADGARRGRSPRPL